MTYTPGPWRRGIGNEAKVVFDNQGRIVAERCGYYDDGNLIAAAPDLLAWCPLERNDRTLEAHQIARLIPIE
jgi:hypothetical protein